MAQTSSLRHGDASVIVTHESSALGSFMRQGRGRRRLARKLGRHSMGPEVVRMLRASYSQANASAAARESSTDLAIEYCVRSPTAKLSLDQVSKTGTGSEP